MPGTSPTETQIESNFNTLLSYLDELKLFADDPTANEPPAFKDFIKDIDFGDVLTENLQNLANSPGFVHGATTDHVHAMEALLRESAIRGFTKRDYYDNSTFAIEREIVHASSEMVLTINRVRGATPIQGGS